MKRVTLGVAGFSKFLHAIAGVSLVGLMLLTIGDVILRAFGRPIPGTLELVGYAGGVAIGLAMPFTSWLRGHVYVDAFIARLPHRVRGAVNIATRLLGIGLFAVLSWNLMKMGAGLRASGEVSPTLELRYYPVVYGLAAACAVQAMALVCHVGMIIRGQYE